ncbi:hypothetical protein OKW50_007693 [Paraburkholderia youngii]|uniref:hypothetical protein n=1 Tax=Paraburkholderia youngii TaxID=2782701 RepID=UPI003D24FA09
MKKQIAAATVIGAMLALVCLLWEQQSFAALHKHSTCVPANSLSPIDRHLRRA